MSLWNALGGSLEQIALKALPGIVQTALPGGLNALLDRLRQAGYGPQVESWLGRGPNAPITAEDLRKALDNAQVQAIAAKLGLPMDRILPILAQALPETVDRNSPDGTLEAPRT